MIAGIPDKLFFKIGEVAEIVLLRPSVLRFWETEFDGLRPNKSKSGQRLYSRKNIEQIFEIKRLLYAEKLTIEGARQRINVKIKSELKEYSEVKADSRKLIPLLSEIRSDLIKIRNSI